MPRRWNKCSHWTWRARRDGCFIPCFEPMSTRLPGLHAMFRVEKAPIHVMTSSQGGIVDITRRQLGRLAAVGTGALLLPGLLPPSRAAAATPPAGTWGDQGDGTYVNPIIPGDFSDWD